jgi:hypothetical protein
MACVQQARTRILDRVGFLSHHGTSPGQARVRYSTPPRARPILWLAAAQTIAASRQASPHGSTRPKEYFLVCETSAANTPRATAQPPSHISGNGPGRRKTGASAIRYSSIQTRGCLAKSAELRMPRRRRSFQPQAEIDVKSLSSVAQSLASFFGIFRANNQAAPGLRRVCSLDSLHWREPLSVRVGRRQEVG